MPEHPWRGRMREARRHRATAARWARSRQDSGYGMECGEMELRDVSAVVTGGGSGLGAAAARSLAGRGVRVAIFDQNLDAAQAVAGGIGALAQRCDVRDAESVEHALSAAAARHGEARILVNCAGINVPGRVVGRKGALALD